MEPVRFELFKKLCRIGSKETRTSPIFDIYTKFPLSFFSRKGHSRLALYLSRSLTTPLHGPEAIECICHSSLSDLFSNNIIKIRHTIKTLIDDPSRLCRSPLVTAVSCSSVTTAKAIKLINY
jgi:hypothetical protein